MSSGSTGRPIRFVNTWPATVAAHAALDRFHQWHGRARRETFAYIGLGYGSPPDGDRHPSWGPVSDALDEPGTVWSLDSATPLDQQVEWLCRVEPDHLHGYPSNLVALAREFGDGGKRLPTLRTIVASSEAFSPADRQDIEAGFGIAPSETYGARECPAIACQPSGETALAVSSELVLCEVLDGDGAPVRPGESGRVVVTALANLAMPLIRYEIGDHAVPGKTPGDGIRLPRLERVLGRTRNMFTYPDGTTNWPSVYPERLNAIVTLQQRQFVQHSRDHIEMKYVRDAEIPPATAAEVNKYLAEAFHRDCRFTLTHVSDISRHPSGKFEEYLSRVTAQRAAEP